MSEAPAPLIFIIAGEHSGDALGAKVMAGLKQATDGHVRIAGIGGPEMAAQGLQSLFPMRELAIMGLLEVIPHIPRVLRRIDETVKAIEAARPDAVLTIDAPGFCFRVAKKLHGQGIPLVHLVAPTVWAWKPKRAEKIAKFLDHLLVILPFEPPYFTRHGLETSYVGHPIVENPAGDGAAFRTRHDIPADATLLAVLPGSRRGEIDRLLPPFAEAVARLARRHQGLRVALPAVDSLRDRISEAVANWPVPVTLCDGANEKADLFAAADLALSAAGTAVLELVLAGVPTVAAYKVNPVSYRIARQLVSLTRYTLPNILLEAEVVPELIQADCTADRLEAALETLLSDPAARARQVEAGVRLKEMLGGNDTAPSRQIADKLLAIAGECAKSRN
ncbi:lipid-A-disaccharide synthase [Oceanibaculum indicum]|uniref:Lipid-A-disaccharide synthase n=1 Tax=Oceanibaculum indicum TaxID=526216 RepID=A0A420WPK3_9PROT|nr:lipid-A-disaccharide synthase [Oceanibaculum indicum]RKQ72968.1 lipid-A-disaccharide synthase [Oceanibaculum indicum]